MQIETSRFGWVKVDDERVLTFPRGLLGFPEHSQFALIQNGSENYFFWLQSVDEPGLAFVVTDPTIYFPDYNVPVREEAATELQLTDEQAVQVMVICNKVGDWITGNLLGPLMVNSSNRLATQVILTEKRWTTRQPLVGLGGNMTLRPQIMVPVRQLAKSA